MDRNAQLSDTWILHPTTHSERVVIGNGNGNGNVYGLREKRLVNCHRQRPEAVVSCSNEEYDHEYQ